MLVTQALAQIKLLDSRIQKLQAEQWFHTVQHQKTLAGAPAETAERQTQGLWDSYRALVEQRQALKNKIILTNAHTRVTIGDITVTVAEAIEAKRSFADRRMVLQGILKGFLKAQQQAEQLNSKLEVQLQEMAKAGAVAQGSADVASALIDKMRSDSAAKVSSEPIALMVSQEVESLSSFLSDVDSALSISNATTELG